MALGKFVSYLRVSTERQGRSGLGLEAQRGAVEDYLNGGSWELVAEYVEVETGKKSDMERPELSRALSACRLHPATLVVAKLDRLARNTVFLLTLRDAGVEFVAADMPAANRMMVGVMALFAEEEARMISERTRGALQAAKARGVRLGNPQNLTLAARRKGSQASILSRSARTAQQTRDLSPIVDGIRRGGATSLRQIAAELNGMGIATPRGSTWTATQVRRLVSRLSATKDHVLHS